jgi:hypothetical protein
MELKAQSGGFIQALMVINLSSGSNADEYFDWFPSLKPKDLAADGGFLSRRNTQLSGCVRADAQLSSKSLLTVHIIPLVSHIITNHHYYNSVWRL